MAICIAMSVIAVAAIAWAWLGLRNDTDGTRSPAGEVADTAALVELVAEAERLGRAVAEGPPREADGGGGRLSTEVALWGLCWQTTAALNEVLVRTTRDSKIVLLGELYPRLIDTCIDGVAARAGQAPESR